MPITAMMYKFLAPLLSWSVAKKKAGFFLGDEGTKMGTPLKNVVGI